MKRRMAFLTLLCLFATLIFGCSSAQKAVDTSSVVDVDLSTMSATMVYSYVYDMMRSPENFEGKTIRAEGKMYRTDPDPDTGAVYYYLIISDATACCQQGLEFIYNNNKDPYPEDNSTVLVSGVFSHYVEEDLPYYYIKADAMTLISPPDTDS